MEYLFYYFIAALSFAIMYTYRYAIEIVRALDIALLIVGKDFEHSDEFRPGVYIVVSFLMSFLLMPAFAVVAIFGNRYNVISDAVASILVEHYGFASDDEK